MDKPGEVNLEKANWEKMRRMSMKELLTNIGVLVGFIILCWGGCGVMSAITADSFGDDSEWSRNLKKPSFNPPSFLFAPVWAVLYLLMAIAAFAVWTKTGFTKRPLPLIVFFIQLALNFLWILVYGLANNLGASFVIIMLLLVGIFLTMVIFHTVQGRAWTYLLLLPYIAWTTFASVVSYSIYDLNRD
ncbi:tryptophan-rich protein TspO-like isoform X2 [Bolinopsis microptera]|uniref:tryptophan-rich protein TspO-like isoform X2 n=1 Tax=Bolinopsis microptera TaxID=2820187 RepID=UPI00307A6400